MDVNIGKGITLSVDESKLPANALQHVIYIGLRNVLMDAHASITTETNPNDLADVAKAVSEKKLAALMAGEVRVSSAREGDPVKAEAIRIASDMVKKAIRKAGKKVSDYKTKAIRDKAVELVGKNPSITETAKKRVAELRATDIEVEI